MEQEKEILVLETAKLVSVKSQEVIPITPYELRDQKSSLKQKFKDKQFKWSQKYSGIIIKYKSIKSADNTGLILDEIPYIFVLVNYRIKILEIKPDILLRCTVTSLFSTHIALLLFGVFNVVVYAQDIAQNLLTYNEESSEWSTKKTH